MDAHVQSGITSGLRRRGIDVLTAQDDGHDTVSDAILLQRASSLGRILVTQDCDLLAITAKLHRQGSRFVGVIYGHHQKVGIGRFVEDLELIATTNSMEEWVCRLEYLPLD
jgi:hypothetical protein